MISEENKEKAARLAQQRGADKALVYAKYRRDQNAPGSNNFLYWSRIIEALSSVKQ
jgi:hypothetical protein